MKTLLPCLCAAALLACDAATASDPALYRETFPDVVIPGDNGGTNVDESFNAPRGQDLLNEGWDIIRSVQTATSSTPIRDIVAPELPVVSPVDNTMLINVRSNGGTIFGNDNRLDLGQPNFAPKGAPLIDGVTPDGGVNNSQFATGGPFVPGDSNVDPPILPIGGLQNGRLFASNPSLGNMLAFTEEVPAGTMVSDVNFMKIRSRNNGANDVDGSQVMRAALKVDGNWYASDVSALDTDSDNYTTAELDLTSTLYAPMTVSQLTTQPGTYVEPILDPNTMEVIGFEDPVPALELLSIDEVLISGAFDQSIPDGEVEAWGYFSVLTSNQRIDFVEFSPVPEPTAAAMALLALGAAGIARRR